MPCLLLPQISARDLEPALAWVEEHRAQLALASASSAHHLEFRLHRLRFVQLLTTRGGGLIAFLSWGSKP